MEKKEIVLGELSKLQVGNNFASGIYNVTLSNGSNEVTRKVVVKK